MAQRAHGAARHSGIEAGRTLGFLAVVLIHTVTPDRVDRPGSWILLCCRAAVPFFFVAAGVFLPREEVPLGVALKRIVSRLLLLYLLWVAVYLLLFDHGVARIASPKGLARTLLTGLPGYHLWFIPSLAIASAAVLALRRRFAPGRLLALAAIVYGAGMLLGAPYAPILFGRPILPFAPRNVGLLAVFFVAAGNWLRARRAQIPLGVGVALAIGGLAVQAAECLALSRASGAALLDPIDFTFGTTALGVGAFMIAAAPRFAAAPAGVLARAGGLTLGAYLLHPAIIYAVQHLIRARGLTGELLVAAVAAAATLAIVALVAPLPVLGWPLRVPGGRR